jgi:Carboxypeptidase regulatory-like domain
MSRFALLFLLPALLTAQTAAQTTGGTGGVGAAPPAQRTAPPTPTEDLCALEGQVLNAVSGEPLKKASLSLMRMDISPGEALFPNGYGATSDAQGKFAIKDIEPGKYRLVVNRNGYVAMAYGARGPGRPGTMLSLVRQQHMKEMIFKLTPNGVIAGRILDEDGEPLPYVRVTLQSYRYFQGRKQLFQSGGGGNTDDLGEFRIFGVPPGKYFLNAMTSPTGMTMAMDRSVNASPEEDYATTYYPGTTDAATAVLLDVGPGAQLRGVDMTLSKAHSIHLKGHITQGLPGTDHRNARVYVTPRSAGGFMGATRTNAVDARGNFDIRGVTPGLYNLTAVVNEGNVSYQGRIPIDAGSSNIEGLNVTIGPGLTVSGHLRAEGDAAKVDLSTIRLNLRERDPGGIMFGNMSQGSLTDEGSFEIKDAPPGRYDLDIMGLPAGFYVKSVRAGETDVLLSGLDLTGGAAAKVDIAISPNAAVVTGTVQNPNTGNAAPGATVMLIPQEKERHEQQSYYRVTLSDQNGSFTLNGLTPGEYKAYAWEDLEAGAYMDTEVMKPLESKSEALSLHESDRKTLKLTLIPADFPASAATGTSGHEF